MTGIGGVDEHLGMALPLDGRGAKDCGTSALGRRVRRGVAAFVAVVAVLMAGACASDEEKLPRGVAA